MTTEPRKRYGRVVFATLKPLSMLGDDNRAAIDRALVPGTRKERHRRLWRVGQCRREGASLVGRIGFERPEMAEVWDETTKDFTEREIRAGFASPFAISPAQLRVAFQPRLNLIKVMSFTGALQALMNAASPKGDHWRVYQELHDIEFYAWATGLDRIETLRLRLERPNPSYHGRSRVEKIIEGTNARMVELVLNAEPQSDLNVNDDLVREAIQHVQDEYGSYSAAGELGGEAQRWDSKAAAAAEVREKIPADPATGEIPSQGLREALGDHAPSTEVDADDGE